MYNSERLVIKNHKKEKYEDSLNVSFSSNNSFYEQLNVQTKRDIIFLIKSGYNKKLIIKLYIFAKPSNINEATNYLTKVDGIYQHIFYSSPFKEDCCEICGEKEIIHINKLDKTSNISFNTIINRKNEKIEIFKLKTKEEKRHECKICEEEITKQEEIRNKCDKCYNNFCDECLYLYVKESIKNGKHALFCPNCELLYTEEKIERIFSFGSNDKNEVNKLRKLLEKSSTKEIILSNPDLMFCPIVDCDGFSKKNSEQEYNSCNKGHKFCVKCGELWHEDGQCKAEQEVDKLFQEYFKRYKLKNCPYCKIVTIKKGGCNHIKCNYCKKDWCWLCQKIFNTTEEHYGNRSSPCFNQMTNVIDREVNFCSKCETEINGQNFKRFRCAHLFCYNCITDYLLKTGTMIIFPLKIFNCLMVGCNGIRVNRGELFVKFVNERNNEKLNKKYKISILFFEYLLDPFFPRIFGDYMEILCFFYEFISKLFDCCRKYEIFYTILEYIGIAFGVMLFPVFLIMIPIFPHYAITRLYYKKFIKEIKMKFNNKLILYSIISGEVILFTVLMFGLIIMHFLYIMLFLPILGIVVLIRNKIYGLPIC